MEKIVAQVREELNRQSDEKENTRVKRALKEVTQKIESALMKNKEWCPSGLLPVGEPSGNGLASIKDKTGKIDEIGKTVQSEIKDKPRKKRVKRPHLKQLTPSAFVKKMKIGQMNLALILDHFGPDGPESFIEGEVIFISS